MTAAVLLLSMAFYVEASDRSSSSVIGTFINEGQTTVEVNAISKDARDTTIFTLSPGQIDRSVIADGLIKVFAPAEDMSSRRLLSTRTTPTPVSAAEFFERKTRTFYFRVVDAKVILVRPQDLTANENKLLEEFKRQLQNDGSYNSGLRSSK